MRKCKLIHIKALEIATKYLPPSNFFLNHLLGSFNKNYKFLLDEIVSIDVIMCRVRNQRLQLKRSRFKKREKKRGIVRKKESFSLSMGLLGLVSRLEVGLCLGVQVEARRKYQGKDRRLMIRLRVRDTPRPSLGIEIVDCRGMF